MVGVSDLLRRQKASALRMCERKRVQFSQQIWQGRHTRWRPGCHCSYWSRFCSSCAIQARRQMGSHERWVVHGAATRRVDHSSGSANAISCRPPNTRWAKQRSQANIDGAGTMANQRQVFTAVHRLSQSAKRRP